MWQAKPSPRRKKSKIHRILGQARTDIMSEEDLRTEAGLDTEERSSEGRGQSLQRARRSAGYVERKATSRSGATNG